MKKKYKVSGTLVTHVDSIEFEENDVDLVDQAKEILLHEWDMVPSETEVLEVFIEEVTD